VLYWVRLFINSDAFKHYCIFLLLLELIIFFKKRIKIAIGSLIMYN